MTAIQTMDDVVQMAKDHQEAKEIRQLYAGETGYAVVKHVDMSERMQQHAVDCIAYAFGEKTVLDDIAQIIKTEFDTMYDPTWHCIVGRSFGSYQTHQSNNYIFMYWGDVGVLLFKTES